MSAYLIAEIEVTDPVTYARYTAQTPAAAAAFGGRFIVRGGATDAREGAPPAGRVVVMEFPDMAAARAYFDSPAYREIVTLRHAAATSRVFLVEGS